MLSLLIRFELALQTRQIGFWVTCTIMFCLGFLISGTDFTILGAEGGERIKTNGSIHIASSMAGISLLTLFFAAVFTVTGVMRDDTYNFLEIVHTTSIKTFDLAFSRMSGVCIATFLCTFANVIGMLVGQLSPWADSMAFGPLNPTFYLLPTLLFLGINALLVSSAYMAVAVITRNKSLVYVSAVALFMLYTAVGIFVGENSPDLVASLADPFGDAALEIVTKYWAPVEQNEMLMPLNGLIGLNRLVWLVAAVLIFAVTLRSFKRGIVKSKKLHKKNEVAVQPLSINTNNVNPQKGIKADLNAFLARFKLEFLTIVKSVAFIILTLLAISLFIISIYYATSYQADPTLPTSATMVQIVLTSFGLSMLIITIFFGSDIMWRDRSVNMHEILDATPVKNVVLVTSKWLAMFAVIITLVMLGIVIGIIAQTTLGDVPVHPWTYLKVGLIAFAISMLVDSVAVMFLQNFMPGRLLGMLIAAVFFVIFGLLSFLPFYHPLMSYGGGMSPGAYSEINGFNGLSNMLWWLAYWGGLILIFLVLSILLLRRGTQTSLRSRLKGMRAQIGPFTSAVGVLGMICFIGFGGTIYKRMSIDENYMNRKAQERLLVEYEQIMKPYTTLPQPKIRSVEVEVDFKPSEQNALVFGRYELENATGKPLETMYVSMVSSHAEDILQLDVAGATIDFDAADTKQLQEYQLRKFTFSPALPAGGTTTLNFETYLRPPRLGDDGLILKNGTFVNNGQIMPQIGVRDNFMSDPDMRRKYHLPKLEKRPNRDNMAAREINFFGPTADYVDFKATVCTDIGQTGIAPGTLIHSYKKSGQSCRVYEANRPILNFFSFTSQDFAQEFKTWTGDNGKPIDVVIYYHQGHEYNISHIMDAATASLDIFSQEYGPYQYEQLRIMEFPYGSFAQAFAGTIPLSENLGFVQDTGDPEDPNSVDLASYVTMHETAHQWFAHQIVPADVKGLNVLSEGLAENAAMTAYERILGWGKARRILKQRAIHAYLTGRATDLEDELPLAVEEGHAYQDYAKSSWVFWGLRHTVGADVINGAVKKLVTDFGSKGPPYPTSMQVVDYLKEAVGPEFHQLVSDYWDRTTFWILKYSEKEATVTKNADGTFKVSMDIIIDKLVTLEGGGKNISVFDIDDVTLNELVEIGFYTKDPTDALGAGWFAKVRIRLSEDRTSVSFDLPVRPTHVLLDPQRLLIERNHSDNLIKLPLSAGDSTL